MVKIRKKRKVKRLKLPMFICFVFVVSCALSLVSSLFLRSYNISLSKEKQNMELATKTLTKENDDLKVEIQTLSNKDRVETIAKSSGMELNQDNIVTIVVGE